MRILEYNMSGFFKSCVDTYLDLAKHAKPLRKVDTPFNSDESLTRKGEAENAGGELGPIAARVLMKVLYGARMCRYDLLRAVCRLATRITKWSPADDRALHRLMSYVNSTIDLHLCGWVGDDMAEWELVLYADADFAGCVETARSTSGVFLCIRGPNTFFPLNSCSKRQTCVSHSTPEAEVVAFDLALRTEGIPGATLWEVLLGRPMVVRVLEDNDACIKMLRSGDSAAMKHLAARTASTFASSTSA